MHGRFRFSLKWFLATVVILGASASFYLSSLINKPIQLEQNAIGFITSPDEKYDNSLTYDELVHAFNRGSTTGSVLDTIQHIQSAEISLIETSVDRAKEQPMLGFAELHRDFYLCSATCILKDGTTKKLKIAMEKNYFHLLDLD